MNLNWTCPHCDRAVTITDDRYSANSHTLRVSNAGGRVTLKTQFLVCPNPDCQQFTLDAALSHSTPSPVSNYSDTLGEQIESWQLVPRSSSKHFPDYVPKVIRDDYEEACLIRDLSPKASATLSRRCLQGILRDYWKVKPARLVDEIAEVKDKIDPVTWKAIEAVRKLGNIGAHMENDINVIMQVDPNEAALLVGLVETLLSEWYVAREERNARMSAVIAAAQKKPSPS